MAGSGVGESYCWPVAPFYRMHPVRGYLNDPRQGAQSSAFHFGVDVSASDGTAVYAVEPGTVYMEGAQNVAVQAPDGSHEFGYWHLIPAVSEHQVVTKGQLLGHIAQGWQHVHFAERRGGDYLNPLRAGALTPFTDDQPPEVTRIVCSRAGAELDPINLHGGVDLIVEAFDRPALPVPAPWAGMPVAPASIRWRVIQGRTVARAWHSPFDLATRMLPEKLYPIVYAPGTRQNHPNQPGLFRYFLAHSWSTSLLPDGRYTIQVEVADVHNNKATGSLQISITNKL
jgi:Peptidase family M23